MFGLHFLAQNNFFFLQLKKSIFFPSEYTMFFILLRMDSRLGQTFSTFPSIQWLLLGWSVWKHFWYIYIVTDPLLRDLYENTAVKNQALRRSVRIGSNIIILKWVGLIISCCKSEYFHEFQLNFTYTNWAC